MRELLGLLFLFAVLAVALKTDIPSKAVAATERWLDGVACAPTHPGDSHDR